MPHDALQPIEHGPSAHAVQHLEFAVDFDGEEAALAQQGWLERFIKREALPLIGQVFDECACDGQLLSIDRIEIDLGASSGPGDDLLLSSRLRERLRAALDAAHAAALLHRADASIVAVPAAELKSLLQFLRSGHSRWNDTVAIEVLGQRVARHDGAALDAELLQASDLGQAMRRRWVAQLGIEPLPELTRAWMVLERAMTGTQPGAWREAWRILFSRRPASLRDLFRRLCRQARARRRLLAALPAGMRDEMFALLTSVHSGQRAAMQALLAEAVRRRPAQESRLWDCMLAHLCFEQAGAELPDVESLLLWADELDGRTEPARLRLEALLAGGVTQGIEGIEGLTAAWRTLWRDDRAGLRRVVRRRKAGKTLRGLLGAQAPVAVRQQLLELLAPGEGEAIGTFLAQACDWHARTHAGAQDGFSDWLWQQAMGLLLVQGAAPSAASCIAALLQQMSERQRMSAGDVALGLRVSLQAAPQGSAASRQVLQILHGLATVRATPGGLPAVQPMRVPESAGIDQRIAALCTQLKQQVPWTVDEARHWEAEARALLAQHREVLQPALRSTLALPQAASRLTAMLPSSTLAEVLQLLRPRDHELAQRCVRLVAQACDEVDAAARRRIEPLGWQFLMRELVEEGRRFVAAAFSGRFLDFLSDKLRWAGRSGWRDAVRRAIARMAGPSADTLTREVVAGVSAHAACTPTAVDATPPDAACAGAFVSNAGVVLAAPYLERLFSMLGLLKEQAFIDEAAQERAVHLLHFLSTGDDESPEPVLLLPKFLCGMDAATVVVRSVGLLPREREAVEGLLAAMIGHWKVLGHTSVAGLRETFLRREGRLMRENDRWRLEVATGPFDMLLDQLPWGYGTVKLPWMPEVLHVQWR